MKNQSRIAYGGGGAQLSGTACPLALHSGGYSASAADLRSIAPRTEHQCRVTL